MPIHTVIVSTIDQTGYLDWERICKTSDLGLMGSGLPNYFLCNDRERKKGRHYGGKIMRESTLHMSGRTRERILFV